MVARKNDQPQATAIPAIPVPSADLINYRFDQNDKALKEMKDESTKRFDALNTKLDDITTTFLTKEEAHSLKEEHDKDIRAIWKKFDDQRWYWRAIVTAVLLCFATAVAELLTKHR